MTRKAEGFAFIGDFKKPSYHALGSFRVRSDVGKALTGILIVTLTAEFLPLSFLGLGPHEAQAVIQSLNSQTGSTQNFATSSVFTVSSTSANIFVSSTNNLHIINWSGILQPAFGGTGASSFATGSILFFQGGKFSEDNSNLFWDDTNNGLGIGTTNPQGRLEVQGGNLIVGGAATSTITGDGANSFISNLVADSLSVGFDFDLGTGLIGGDWTLTTDASPSFPVGGLKFRSGGSGENVIFERNDSAQTSLIVKANGRVGVGTANPTGTLQVLGGVNSTVYIGDSTRPGCLVLGDSDSAGVTYVIANDGVLTATTTKPSIC